MTQLAPEDIDFNIKVYPLNWSWLSSRSLQFHDSIFSHSFLLLSEWGLFTWVRQEVGLRFFYLCYTLSLVSAATFCNWRISILLSWTFGQSLAKSAFVKVLELRGYIPETLKVTVMIAVVNARVV